jgi:hypothetical protein
VTIHPRVCACGPRRGWVVRPGQRPRAGGTGRGVAGRGDGSGVCRSRGQRLRCEHDGQDGDRDREHGRLPRRGVGDTNGTQGVFHRDPSVSGTRDQGFGATSAAITPREGLQSHPRLSPDDARSTSCVARRRAKAICRGAGHRDHG